MKCALVLPLVLPALGVAAASPVDAEGRSADAVDERAIQARRRGNVVATIKPPPDSETVNCRKGTDTSSEIETTFKRGDEVEIKYQAKGQTIGQNEVWDRIDRRWAKDCFITDYYVYTGYAGWHPDSHEC